MLLLLLVVHVHNVIKYAILSNLCWITPKHMVIISGQYCESIVKYLVQYCQRVQQPLDYC
jgi:hypothetical protein